MAVTTHIYQIYIRATPEQVWTAITDPSWTKRYFHATAFTSTLEPGSPVRYVGGDGDAVEGVIEVAEPPHRLITTWRSLYDAALAEEPPSRVEWQISSAGEGLTLLRLVHGDLARSPLTWAQVKDGWVWILDSMKSLIETGEPLPDAARLPDAPDDVTGQWHRAQGIECNNSTWDMIEADRTPANDEEMLRRAYASAYHWQRAARRAPANEARALWLLAKVQLLAGRSELSLHYADRCMTVCLEHGLVDFDLAYAHEARARALQALGRTDDAAVEWGLAKAVPVADPEDQAILDADLAVGP